MAVIGAILNLKVRSWRAGDVEGEKTVHVEWGRDDPRACGVDIGALPRGRCLVGRSPRVRGRPA